VDALQSDKRYTYADYLTWDETIRCELFDGVPCMMSPAPSRMHQDINMTLSTQLNNFLADKPCKVYAAPFDVRLSVGEGNDTIVQPDIVVVCDRTKLDEKGCLGAPDLIVEILSPSSAAHDRVRKFNKYRQAGVREYWIVDPESKTVNAYILENEKYTAVAWSQGDTMCSHVLSGFMITLADLFGEFS